MKRLYPFTHQLRRSLPRVTRPATRHTLYRPYSTTFASSNLTLKPTAAECGDNGSTTIDDELHSTSAMTGRLLLREVMTLMTQNDFNEIINVLKINGSLLSHNELSNILHLLQQFDKHRHILTLLALFKFEIVQSQELLELTLSSAYKECNYALFDDLFNVYIESPWVLNAAMFNLALKVYLKTNPGLASRFLFEMFRSDHPINENTIYEYLKVAEKETTFQSIKFVVSMLERYPLTAINDNAYGVLYRSYLRHGTSSDLKALTLFLQKRQVLQIESIKVAELLYEFEGISLPETWERFKVFKIQHSLTEQNLKHCYDVIYKLHYKTMGLNDVYFYVEQMQTDGLQVAQSSILQKVIYHLRNEEKLIQYIKSIKDTLPLDQFIVRAIWSRLISNNPDYGQTITNKFQSFASVHKGDSPWMDSLLCILQMRIKRSKETRFLVSDRHFADTQWKLEQIAHLSATNKSQEIITFINSLLRLNIKPDIRVLSSALSSLIKLQSPLAHDIYQTIHDLYQPPPFSVEIQYFKCQIQKHTNGRKLSSKKKRQALIDTFTRRNAHRMNHLHYIQLASYLNDMHCTKAALEYLSIAKSLTPTGEERFNSSIYNMSMKVLSQSHNGDALLSVMKHIASDSNVEISQYMLRHITQYCQSIISRMAEGKAKVEFINQVEEIRGVLKKRFLEKKHRMLTNTDEIVKLLGEWAKETKD